MSEPAAEGADAWSRTGFVRINVLLVADILVEYALFVMQDYLTEVWKLSFTHAAAILNFWGGIVRCLPVFFLFLVDAVLGNFTMLLISSISYSVGISLLTMSTPPFLANATGTCKQSEPECIGHTQKVLFYTGMALIAIGVAGNLVSLKPFRKEQVVTDPGTGIGCLKIPGFILVVIVSVVGAIALPYIKPWTVRFGIPALCTILATFLFLSGLIWLKYNKVKPSGSPITNICRVYVAATSKMCIKFPLDAKKLHRDNEIQRFKPSRFLRGMEKAAVISDMNGNEYSKWRLCSIREVEEAKIAVRMVPMWMTFIICGIVSSVTNTYFVEQAKNMNRNVGILKLPPQVLLLVFDMAKKLFGCAADRVLCKEPRENESSTETTPNTARTPITENTSMYKKISPAIGIGMAMTFSVLCCVTAARIEGKRLGVIRRHGLLDKPDEDVPMSVYWLLFQFILLAGLDSFLEKSVAEFYRYQAPDSMEKYLSYFTKGVYGLGYMSNVLCVYVVGKVSARGGKRNWFQDTLNRSRLDSYYWVLAALSAGNLIVFILVALCYKYKNLTAETQEVDGAGDIVGESGLYEEGLIGQM